MPQGNIRLELTIHTMTQDNINQIAHELNFWKEFVTTQRFLKGWCQSTSTPELQFSIREFLGQRFTENPLTKVLDMGSGVCSILHGFVPSGCLTAADPLSPLYQIIFPYHQHGFPPPLAIRAEELEAEYEYDVVHICNALDHSQDAPLALARLWRAVKQGGWLVVAGFEDEANTQNGEGFHRWNISVDRRVAGELTIENFFEDELLPATYQGKTLDYLRTDEGRMWFAWAKQKTVNSLEA